MYKIMKIGYSIKNKSIISKLIGYFTNSSWSHCFIITDYKIGDDTLILESHSRGGVSINLLSKYTKNNNFTIEIHDLDLKDTSLEILQPYMGKYWGFLQSLGYLLSKYLKLKSNPFHDGIWCSELVLLWLLTTKIKDKFKHLDIQKTTPEDIYKITAKIQRK